MLAAQMAVAHLKVMASAKRSLTSSDTREERQAHEGSYNRFARTFVLQIEALKRYRSGGEQKITVQHMQNSVAMEGHAFVGNVVSNSSREPPAVDAPTGAPLALTDARELMPIVDDRTRAPVPARLRTQRE